MLLYESVMERKKKKKTTSFSSSLRTKENGFDREPLHSEHPSKRPCTISPGQRYSPNNGLSYQPNGLPHPTPPPQHYRLDDMAIAHHYRDSYRHPSHRDLRDRNRPMGKTEDLCNSYGMVCFKTCVLAAQLNFRLEICDGVKIRLLDLMSPL